VPHPEDPAQLRRRGLHRVRVVTAVLSGAAVVGTAAAAVAVAGADAANAGTGTSTGATTSDDSGGSLMGPSGFGSGNSSGGAHAASGGS
jgi:hypothetical protein